MDNVLLSQQWLWQQFIIQEAWMKTKRKNPAVEAILFSKSINNLHYELREDFFFSVFTRNLPRWWVNWVILLLSSQKFFPFPYLALSDLGNLSIWHYKWERTVMTLWNLKIPVKDEMCLRGNYFLFKVEKTLWVSWATYLKWLLTCLNLLRVWNVSNAVFHHQTDNILIKGKSILYLVK